jgi:putative nucleotidyltransferase with HDIG domain
MARRSLRYSDSVIAAGAIAALVISVVLVITGHALSSISELRVFGAFALLVAASEMFEVTLPNNTPFSLGIAPALGFALLGSILPKPFHRSIAEVMTMFALGVLIATGMRMSMKKGLQLVDSATHFIALAGGTAVYQAFAALAHTVGQIHPAQAFIFNTCQQKLATGGCPTSVLPNLPREVPPFTDLSVFGLLAMLLVVVLIETTLNAFRQVDRNPVPLKPVFVGQVRSTGALHLSILSVGALLAIAYPPLGVWSFPLFLAPLAATQFAFRQFASIRKTYLQTIGALSRVPEMAGYTQPGHSKRVAQLAIEIAAELGVQQQEIDEIEYAALLHDIGRVSIPDPADAVDASKLELALTGGGIVRETGHFPRVADMIEKQNEPYRRRGEDANPDLSLGAKIIKVCSAFDDMTRPGATLGLSTWDVLEKLHLGMAYDYDPQVIQALTRVLEKRGEA